VPRKTAFAARMDRRVDRPGPPSELRALIVRERLLELGSGVHDERTVRRHRFADRPPLQQKDVCWTVPLTIETSDGTDRLEADAEPAGCDPESELAKRWSVHEASRRDRPAASSHAAPASMAIDQIATSASWRAAHECGAGQRPQAVERARDERHLHAAPR
jgi:hypothetical protein